MVLWVLLSGNIYHLLGLLVKNLLTDGALRDMI